MLLCSANPDAACLQVYPEKGTVSFSAGLHGWAFTLTSFAKIYAKRFGVEVRTRDQLACCGIT